VSDANQNAMWQMIGDLSTKQGITEIVVNSAKSVFVERDGKFIQLAVQIPKSDMYGFIKEVAEFNRKECNDQHPILDGILPDGSRVNVIRDPFANKYPAITIRKYLPTFKTFEQAPNAFGLTPKWIMFFKAAVKARLNMVISGGTGVGKTTFMNLMLSELPAKERVVTIEDTLELDINVPNNVRLESQSKSSLNTPVETSDLVKNTLRMRPDRIIIGEVRGGEFFDLLQAMNTGHEGSMTSIHANSSAESFSRMESLYMMSGHDLPYQVIRKQMSLAIDLVIQLGRNRQGMRHISEIREITGIEGDTISSQAIARWEDDELVPTGLPFHNKEKLIQDGLLTEAFF
jgi:pilus assembly protein CpaF